MKMLKRTIYKLVIGLAIEDLSRSSSNYMQVLSYSEVEVATNNFSSENKLERVVLDLFTR